MTDHKPNYQTVKATDLDWLDKVQRAARYGSGSAVDFIEVRPEGDPVRTRLPLRLSEEELEERLAAFNRPQALADKHGLERLAEPEEDRPLHPLTKIGVWTCAVAISVFFWAIVIGFIEGQPSPGTITKLTVNIGSILGLFGGLLIITGWGHRLLQGEDT